MHGEFSPISGRGNHRIYNDHLSLSEQASPSRGSVIDKNPTDAIKFMVALLSLENTILRAEIRHLNVSYGFHTICIKDHRLGGGDFGADNFDRLTKDLQFYQNKSMALELELSKRNKKEPEKANLPVKSRERSPIAEIAHNEEAIVTVAMKRNQSYYDKKVYGVRNRTLLFHSLTKWLDLSRILNADENNKPMLAFFAFSKWKLKCSYKVAFCDLGCCNRRRSNCSRYHIH